MDCFDSSSIYSALLYQPDAKQWLYFKEPLEILTTSETSDVLSTLKKVEQHSTGGKYAAGFLSYEAATQFEPSLPVHAHDDVPLIWFGIYDQPKILVEPDTPASTYSLNWEPSISENMYLSIVDIIKGYICNGDTYQINFSFDLKTKFQKNPYDLFRFLSCHHPSPYSAYINLDTLAIASFSPELFFSLKEGTVCCRPMKGTIKRGRTLPEDIHNAQTLFRSEKNRAENIMIVDMIRNDLGKIAETGSVSVDTLFEIEKYKTVFQMTSSVKAQTKKSFAEIFQALFPCASITGAPKIRSSQIIHEIEKRPRGIYCGSIGYISPQKNAQFNVAIRTITFNKSDKSAIYNVGSGIIWDSDAADEYRECIAKANILHTQDSDFYLLESLLYEPKTGYFLLEEHIHRCIESALYFDFKISEDTIRNYLTSILSSFGLEPVKVRITIKSTGAITHSHSVLSKKDSAVSVTLSKTNVHSTDPFLYHKTTNRQLFQVALSTSKGHDDVILWNERGEITETTIGNIVLRMNGNLVTPSAESGLLCGTFRSHLLKNGIITESVLTKNDLLKSTEIFRINSVRKWQRCILS